VGQSSQNEQANLMNAGQARASGYVGSANALAGALSGIGQAATSYPLLNAQIGYLSRGAAGGVGGNNMMPGTNAFNMPLTGR
jgi:hypothetical protein